LRILALALATITTNYTKRNSMSKLFLLFVFTSTLISDLNAQVTTVVSNFDAYDIAIDGNDLYFSDFAGHRILKIDITIPSQTPVEIVTDLTYPTALEIKDGELYFCESSSSKISKIDLSISNPIPVVVIGGISYPVGLAFYGDELFISRQTENKISKIDVTLTNPTPTDVVTGLNTPNGIAIHNNELFISETGAAKISKIDINISNPLAIDVATNLNSPTGLSIKGNQLYIADFTDSKIYTLDLTSTSLIATELITNGMYTPRNVALSSSNRLFISDTGYNKVFEADSSVLLTTELELMNSIRIFPNPSTDFINILGLNGTKIFELYNSVGKLITSGEISEQESFEIGNLDSGVYFLKLEQQVTIKFSVY
jgi:DNA-binding beta-propeller fold protein YncE